MIIALIRGDLGSRDEELSAAGRARDVGHEFSRTGQ